VANAPYLYRPIDKHGVPLDFLLTAKRDLAAAGRFFRKALKDQPLLAPGKIETDGASVYPKAFSDGAQQGLTPGDVRHRVSKHLQQGIESDHFHVKKNMPKVGGFPVLWRKRHKLSDGRGPIFWRMAETHVISALKAKRAEVSGHIHDLEKRIARHRANLASIDATIRLFSPETDPDAIPPKRPYRRTRYFAHNELPRRALNILRETGRPLGSGHIADAVIAAKRMPSNDSKLRTLVVERVATTMRGLLKRGLVEKTGTSRDVVWRLV